MPRFVILFHDHPFPHWDLMLESGDRLQTWRLLEEPGPDNTVPAERLPDHRLLYLDYEGPVSGNRGQVSRRDGGTFELEHDDERCRIILNGSRMRLPATLIEPPAGGLSWEFGAEAGPPSPSEPA